MSGEALTASLLFVFAPGGAFVILMHQCQHSEHEDDHKSIDYL